MDRQTSARREGEGLKRMVEEQRYQSEQLANDLSERARQQWTDAIKGAFALPAAAALSMAARTLYVGAFIERGLGLFQRSTEAVKGGLESASREIREAEEQQRRMESGSAGQRPRTEGGGVTTGQTTQKSQS